MDHPFRHTEGTGKLPDLGLIQVSNGLKGGGGISEDSRIPQQHFGLVAGPHHQPLERYGLVIEHDHTHPCHDIARPHPVHVLIAVDQRIHHVRDLHRQGLHPQIVNHRLGVLHCLVRGGLIGHPDGQHVFGPQRPRGKVKTQGRINTARDPQQCSLEAHPVKLGSDEAGEDLCRKVGVDCQVNGHGDVLFSPIRVARDWCVHPAAGVNGHGSGGAGSGQSQPGSALPQNPAP